MKAAELVLRPYCGVGHQRLAWSLRCERASAQRSAMVLGGIMAPNCLSRTWKPNFSWAKRPFLTANCAVDSPFKVSGEHPRAGPDCRHARRGYGAYQRGPRGTPREGAGRIILDFKTLHTAKGRLEMATAWPWRRSEIVSLAKSYKHGEQLPRVRRLRGRWDSCCARYTEKETETWQAQELLRCLEVRPCSCETCGEVIAQSCRPSTNAWAPCKRSGLAKNTEPWHALATCFSC